MSDRDSVADFGKARRERIADLDSSHTSPHDALALAEDYLNDHPQISNVLVLLEKEDGRPITFCAQTTFAAGVLMLEKAKLSLLLGDGTGE